MAVTRRRKPPPPPGRPKSTEPVAVRLGRLLQNPAPEATPDAKASRPEWAAMTWPEYLAFGQQWEARVRARLAELLRGPHASDVSRDRG